MSGGLKNTAAMHDHDEEVHGEKVLRRCEDQEMQLASHFIGILAEISTHILKINSTLAGDKKDPARPLIPDRN